MNVNYPINRSIHIPAEELELRRYITVVKKYESFFYIKMFIYERCAMPINDSFREVKLIKRWMVNIEEKETVIRIRCIPVSPANISHW